MRTGARPDAIPWRFRCDGRGDPAPDGDSGSAPGDALQSCRRRVFIACKQLVSDVRAAGSWKQYVLHMPKALLRLRSLVARGRTRSIKRLRAKTPREIELLFAPTFPNELFWRVLEYWNPLYEARRTNAVAVTCV